MTADANIPTGQGDGSFDYDMVGSNLGGSTSYSPSAVQTMIDTFFGAHKGPLTEYESAYIMYLMQEYGAQVSGLDANMQDEMNKYFSGVQNLWSTLDDANTTGAPPSGLDVQFENQISALVAELNKDPFFNSPSRDQMRNSMIGTLNSLETTVNNAEIGCHDGLYNLWQQYNPSTSSASQGSPEAMQGLMRQLGEMNQQFTGESQAVAADTKSDVKMWQTEESTMNSWYKALNKCVMYMAQLQRTQ